MILLIVVTLCAALQASTARDCDGVNSEEVDIVLDNVSALVGSHSDFFINTQESLESVGVDLCARLKGLDQLEDETYQQAMAFSKQAASAWTGPGSRPFFFDINGIKRVFNQRFASSEFTKQWKSAYLSVTLLQACDCMSFVCDQYLGGLRKERIHTSLNVESLATEKAFEALLSEQGKFFHINLAEYYQTKKISILIPEEAQGRIGCFQVKYQYTDTGIFSLLDFFACLKQGVLLCTIMKPFQGSHLEVVHEGSYRGAGGILFHDFTHLGAMIYSFKNLYEHFTPVCSNKDNIQALIDLLCKHLCTQPSPAAKAQSLSVLFAWLHERPLFVSQDKIQTFFSVYDSLFSDQQFFEAVLRPLCPQNVQSEYANESFLNTTLGQWHKKTMKALSDKFNLFTPKPEHSS